MTDDLYLYCEVFCFSKGGVEANFSKVWQTLENKVDKADFALYIERGETHFLNVWQTLENKADDG